MYIYKVLWTDNADSELIINIQNMYMYKSQRIQKYLTRI